MHSRLLLVVLFVLTLPGALLAQTATPAIPLLSTWQANMLQYGAQACTFLQNSGQSSDALLAETYYDAERVFYQMYDYTRDPRWLGCSQSAEQVYRDNYVQGQPTPGAVPGYWLFPHGMWVDYQRTQDAQSRTALLNLALNGAYSNSPLAWTQDTASSREVAYNLMVKLLAQQVAGYTDQARIDAMVAQAFGHMDQWFVSRTAPYIRPFMVGLTSEALIMWQKKSGDSRVLPTIQMAMDYLWNCCWQPGSQSFAYTDRIAPDGSGDMSPAPDLNLLIAPAFAWLYVQTGDPQYQQKGDQIFAGGVTQAYLVNGKQFNQSYRWSFDYVAWRQNSVSPLYAMLPSSGGAPVPVSTPPPSTSSPTTSTPSSTPSPTTAAVSSGSPSTTPTSSPPSSGTSPSGTSDHSSSASIATLGSVATTLVLPGTSGDRTNVGPHCRNRRCNRFSSKR